MKNVYNQLYYQLSQTGLSDNLVNKLVNAMCENILSDKIPLTEEETLLRITKIKKAIQATLINCKV